MFLQDAPPDTSRYMIAGYVIFFLISAIYVLSLIVRRRNLDQDLKTLQSMEAERGGSPAAHVATRSQRRPAAGKKAASGRRTQNRRKVTRRK